MAGNIWTWGIDYKNQPLLDAWWTPGWTSQNRDGASIQVPPNQFAPTGFPQNLNYATVTGNYFDATANPVSGFLTFWPSSPLTFLISGVTTYMPQRFSGVNQTTLGINQMGNANIYLWFGQLSVTLLCTDNANMTPASFTYHVIEHYKGGQQYDIVVPSSDVSTGADIHNLIIPGTICSLDQEFDADDDDDRIAIPVTSSQYLAADITNQIGGTGLVPTLYEVDFAFISGPTQPQTSDWHQASWASPNAPYVGQILIGPNGLALSQGTYRIWIRVVALPQEPVIPVGWVTIY